MAEERLPTNKAEAMEYIERSWEELNTALDSLTEGQATGIRDGQGWTVKDHVIHMTAWERSVLFLLNHKPRHEGLGVSEEIYRADRADDDDSINAAIYAQCKDTPLQEARQSFRDTHAQMMEKLQSLTEEELGQPYRYWLPDEPGEGDGPPTFALVLGNTEGHFKEHLGWIRELMSES